MAAVKIAEVNIPGELCEVLWVTCRHGHCALDWLGPGFLSQTRVVFSARKTTPYLLSQPIWGRIRTVVAVNPANMGCNTVNYHLFCSLDEKNKCNYTHECWKMKQSNVDRHIRGAFPNEKLCTMNANGLPLSHSLAYGVKRSFWMKTVAVPSAPGTGEGAEWPPPEETQQADLSFLSWLRTQNRPRFPKQVLEWSRWCLSTYGTCHVLCSSSITVPSKHSSTYCVPGMMLIAVEMNLMCPVPPSQPPLSPRTDGPEVALWWPPATWDG